MYGVTLAPAPAAAAAAATECMALVHERMWVPLHTTPTPIPPCKDKSLVAAVGRLVLRGGLSFGVVAERHSRCAPVPVPLNPVAAAAAAGVWCRVFLAFSLSLSGSDRRR